MEYVLYNFMPDQAAYGHEIMRCKLAVDNDSLENGPETIEHVLSMSWYPSRAHCRRG